MGIVGAYARWRRDRSGATAVEYALLAGMMAVVIVGITAMVSGTNGMYTKIETAFKTHLGG